MAVDLTGVGAGGAGVATSSLIERDCRTLSGRTAGENADDEPMRARARRELYLTMVHDGVCYCY